MNNETASRHEESPQFHCGEDVNASPVFTVVVSQCVHDDAGMLTTAASDPPAVAVTVATSGRILDVHISADLDADVLAQLFVATAQGAYIHRYDPIESEKRL